MALQTGFADIEVINQLLEQNTSKSISEGSNVSLSTVRKLKSGERLVEKMNLLDAIKLTDYAQSLGNRAVIEIYSDNMKK
ncbi:hypothetical protein P7D93_19085 [Enterococcus raffinosus]|uniref:hypothetical protein n=1 Tax=Enterococcus raffinosus TaxID=71452 RepID=UPI00288E25C0|nr:hypothetical protein [Enterococcus raffinosus]MDT2531968.1 hypothetical protein [Enterococcus raffinosus]